MTQMRAGRMAIHKGVFVELTVPNTEKFHSTQVLFQNLLNGCRRALSNQQVKAIRAVARVSYLLFLLACAARIFFLYRSHSDRSLQRVETWSIHLAGAYLRLILPVVRP